MADMPITLPPNVRPERSRHGKIVFYHRIGHGKRTRIKGDPRSEAFKDQAEGLNAGQTQPSKPKPKGGTLLWLAGKFEEQAPANLGLKPSTHDVYADIVRRSAEAKPTRKYSDVTPQLVLKSMQARTPNAANNFLRAMRKLFDWAKDMGFVDVNPTDGITKRKAPKPDAHTWTEAEVAYARKKWPSGTRQRLALEIGASGGLARSDAVKFGPMHIDERGEVKIARTKTGVVMQFYLPKELQAEIEQAPLGFTFFQSARNLPMKDTSFGTWFARQCTDIGLPDRCRYHGLRRYCATEKANKGFSGHKLMTWFGWLSLSEAELYTQKADRSRLSLESREQDKNERIPHLQSEIPHPEKKITKSGR